MRPTVSPGAVVSVLHVGHTHGGVADPVVDHRVHRHRHAVLGQNLPKRLSVFIRAVFCLPLVGELPV